jgi:hypothetical protein
VYSTNTANEQPFVNAGQTSTTSLEGLLGIGGNPAASSAAFQNYLGSTNYQFQLGQGEDAIKTANAPDFNSGATAKALNNYAQGQAGNALSGYEGMLGGLTNTGAGAANALGQQGEAFAAQTASNNNAAAGLEANSNIQGANALSGLSSGVASGLSGLSQNPFVQNAFSGIGNSSFNNAAAAGGGPGASGYTGPLI